jgi:hypothetical protein
LSELGELPVLQGLYLEYLENHDEPRLASPIVRQGGPGASGFGSAEAGYQLAPLQYSHQPA